jgi:glucokinase
MTGSDGGPLFGAVDLGGTKILTAVGDAQGNWLGQDYRPTEVDRGPEGVIERIVASLQASLAQAGGQAFHAIGVAAPGPIDVDRGLILEAPNLAGWRNVPLAAWLSGALGCPAVLENDANAAALGEYAFGAGQGARHMVYVTISTGIGGGLVLDGRLYRGATGAAGELGHMVIEANGPLCGCGRRGHLEALASGTAIAARGAEAVARGESPGIARKAAGGVVTAAHVTAAAVEGDPAAAAIIGRAGQAIGIGLTNIVNVFNPDLIVIGGGTAKIGGPLLDPALETMRTLAFRGPVEHVRVVHAALGDRAGAAGGLALARDLIT